MRNLPIDTTRIDLIGTGKVLAKDEYVELSDGSRRRSGNQAKDDNGVPLWTVDVVVDDDDAKRAEAIGVVIASHDEPTCPKWRPVMFTGLRATIYVDRQTGRAQVSLKAEGIETTAMSRPSPVPAAS